MSEQLGRRGNLVLNVLRRPNKLDTLVWWFWCPGCDIAHRYEADRWQFNGNYERPTFSPSLLCRGEKVCHLFMTDGKLIFLNDCDHALAGKTVDIPEPPNWLSSI